MAGSSGAAGDDAGATTIDIIIPVDSRVWQVAERLRCVWDSTVEPDRVIPVDNSGGSDTRALR